MYGRSFVAALLATTTFVSISAAASKSSITIDAPISGNSVGASESPQPDVRILATVGTPGIVLSKLAIETGWLIVTGKTSSPKIVVQIVGTTLRATSDNNGLFRFKLNYRTSDCRLKLRTKTGTLDVAAGIDLTAVGAHGGADQKI